MRNNLKQIGLACLTHVTAYGALPNGGHCDSGGVSLPRAPGWEAIRPRMSAKPGPGVTRLLPFLESTSLYENTSDDFVWGATPNARATYFCPTRRDPIAIAGGYRGPSTNKPRAMTDYAGKRGQFQ